MKETVCDWLLPSGRPPYPEPEARKTALLELRSLAFAVVASERIGNPIVIQRNATSGRASSTGSARDRDRAILRADGSRRGGST
jgi:hypothetical protein